MTNAIECPECGSAKDVPSDSQQGQLISCGCCGTLLELLSLTPPSVAKAPQIEEDFGE
ncbi:MAG: lysine biosynthesis protein LysW [Candidatus Micrarchaeota archaeon]